MNIKTLFLAVTCFSLIISCKDKEPEGGYDPVSNTDTEYSLSKEGEKEIDDDKEKLKVRSEGDNDSLGDTNPDGAQKSKTKTGTVTSEIMGQFIKIGQESDNSCGCYCLDLDVTTNSELCLVPNEMYITTRLKKNNDKTIDVFLVGPSAKNTKGNDIPWEKFDKNVPIAKISPTSNGEVDMDWLGFMINGDLAMDYAIYGKKTLEGNYKKK